MLLSLENVKSTLHQVQFATKTQYGMVKLVSATMVMWLEIQVDVKNTNNQLPIVIRFHNGMDRNVCVWLDILLDYQEDAKNTHHLSLQFHLCQNVLTIVNLME